jgi:hypothetical protein
MMRVVRYHKSGTASHAANLRRSVGKVADERHCMEGTPIHVAAYEGTSSDVEPSWNCICRKYSSDFHGALFYTR